MKITISHRYFVRNDNNVWLLFLCFLAMLQCSSKSGVVVGSPNPNKDFKKSAFNELRSRQRINKRRIRNDFSTLKSSTSFDDQKSLHGCDVDEFWNSSVSVCSTCTRCSKDKGKTGKSWTLRGCGHDRDTVCGTIGDFQKQLNKLSKKQQGGNRIKISTRGRRRKNKNQYGRNHRSHKSISDEEEEEEQEVYGYIAPRPPSPDYTASFGITENQRKGHRRKLSPRHKLKETVNNWSQGRDEFLKQIHEEDNIDSNYGNYENDDENVSNYGEVNYDYDYEPTEYNEDYSEHTQDTSNGKEEPSLHQEIARIKNQLEYDDADKKGTNDIEVTPPFQKLPHHNSYEISTNTEKYNFQNSWYPSTRDHSKYYYNNDNDITTSKTTEEGLDDDHTSNILVGHTLNVPDFIDMGDEDKDAMINSEYGYAYNEDDITTEVGVFGAVVKQSPKLGEIAETLLEPVDLIGRILHKNNSIISNNANPSKHNEDANSGGGLRLEHGLVVVGFIIGFGFVFAVGLLYAKIQRVRRFKLLDNANAGRKNANTNQNDGVTSSFIEEATCESSLISSRNSSIDSHVQSQQQISNFQMQPKSSPSNSLTSPVGLPSDHLQESRQSRDALNNQKLFPKATLIKPKSAAEVAAKTFPNVNQFQQQILSPVSTIASESSQSQGKLKCLSPNNPSIILSTQEGMGDVVRNVGNNSIISSSSSLFGGSSNQSPVSGTPIQLSNCVTQPIMNTTSSIQQPQNNGQLQQHSTYVDQRGRSQLIKPATPARELPV